jgi:rod shape-determining protein MreD
MGFYFFSAVLAFVFFVFPWPQELLWLRPNFPGICVLYWGLTAGRNVSLSGVFFYGLLLDLFLGEKLGVQALGLVIIAGLAAFLQPLFRIAKNVEQMLLVFFLISLQALIQWLAYRLSGEPFNDFWPIFLPSLTSAFIWPLVLRLLDHWQ